MCENIPGLLLSSCFGQDLKIVLCSRSSLTDDGSVEGFAPVEPAVTGALTSFEALTSVIVSRTVFLIGLGLLTLLVTSGENPSRLEDARFWSEDAFIFDGSEELNLIVSWARARGMESDIGLESRVVRK